MQATKRNSSLRFVLAILTVLLGSTLFLTKTVQAAPAAQPGDPTGAADRPVFLPLVSSGANTSAAEQPLTPDQYDSESENPPALSTDQVQPATWCSTYIKFGNGSSRTIKVYYVNSWGQESLYKTLSAHSYYWQQSYYGNSWKVRDYDGNLLKSLTVDSCSYIYVSIDDNDFPQPTATPTATPSSGACYTTVIATHSNKCLKVMDGSTANGAKVVQYSCDGSSQEYFAFSLVPGTTDTYVITAKHSGKTVDVASSSTSAGAQLVQYSANGSSSQKWQVVPVSGDIYELKNVKSGLNADVEGASTSNGAYVIQWPDTNGTNQRWKISSCITPPTPTATPTATPTNTSVPPTATPTNTSAPQSGSIGDKGFNDLNGNGQQDGGEPGLPGITVQLLDCSDNPLQTTTTNGAGLYSFANLAASCYRVSVPLPSGYSYSPANVGNDATDSDINPNGVTGNINLAAGVNDTSVDAGLIVQTAPTATPTNTPVSGGSAVLGDRVWRDTNSNGVQDIGEPGVSGVAIELLSGCSGGTVVTSRSTNVNGDYTFSNLGAGQYRVRFTLPSGYSGFSPKDAIMDDDYDSDANTDGVTDCITLTNGEENYRIDAGLLVGGGGPTATPTPTATATTAPQLGSIGDKLFLDSNGNGIQDAGEGGVGGVDVQLRACNSSNTLQTTTTDSAGNYSFNNLAAGCYVVRFVNISDTAYAFSPANQGGNEATDSDVVAQDSVTPGIINGQTDNINLGAGQNLTNVDAGLVPQVSNTGSIGDKVFKDSNGNGQQDGGEPGVAGVTVRLLDCSNNELDSTTTDGSGSYRFSGLAAGCYRISVTLPSGYTYSPANVGNDATDSDVNPTNGITGNITLTAGQTTNDVDAGLVPQTAGTGSIGDKVFKDINGNGQQDSGEPGVPGVTVRLTDCAGTVRSTTTDANGNYSFAGLTPGCYTVSVVLPNGYTFSPANVGDDETDSDINPGTSNSPVITVNAGDTITNVDAGLVPQTSGGDTCIGDRVWQDTNANGLQDAGELGLANAEIYLGVDSNNDGRIDRYVGPSTTTDANGNYAFCGLDPNITYTVEFIPPPNCGFTLANVGTDDTIDSDANLNKGVATGVVVPGGQTNNTIDAGFVCW